MGIINRRLKSKVFGSTAFFAIIICILFISIAFSEEETLTQAEKDYAQADTLLKSQKFAEAKNLFLSASQITSDSELAMQSLARAGRCEIRSGNLTAADQLFDKLMNDYSMQPKLEESIYYFGHSYWNAGKFDKAKNAYLFVCNTSTESDLIFKSQAKIASCQIRQSNYSSADQMITVILNSYSKYEGLYTAITGFAEQYQRQKQFEKAKEYCQIVVLNSTDAESAFTAQLRIMQCEIQLGNYTAALTAFEKLHKNHSSAKAFVEKATRVCGDIMQFDGSENVLPYIDRALEVTSDVETAVRLLQFKAQCHIYLGQSQQAQAVRQQIELYSDKEYYPGIQLALAYGCRKNGQYDKAMDIYNNILQSSTDDAQKLDAYAGIAAIAACQGDDSNVNAIVELLCSTYAGHKKLGWAIFVIGEEYQLNAHTSDGKSLTQKNALHKKAINVWKKNIEVINDQHYKCHGYYYTGISYNFLKDYQKSLMNFHKVVNEFPDEKHAASALLMIGRIYQKNRDIKPVMVASGADTNEAAVGTAFEPLSETSDPNSTEVLTTESLNPDVIIINSARTAFELLLERYPNSSSTAYASQWLNRNSSK